MWNNKKELEEIEKNKSWEKLKKDWLEDLGKREVELRQKEKDLEEKENSIFFKKLKELLCQK